MAQFYGAKTITFEDFAAKTSFTETEIKNLNGLLYSVHNNTQVFARFDDDVTSKSDLDIMARLHTSFGADVSGTFTYGPAIPAEMNEFGEIVTPAVPEGFRALSLSSEGNIWELKRDDLGEIKSFTSLLGTYLEFPIIEAEKLAKNEIGHVSLSLTVTDDDDGDSTTTGKSTTATYAFTVTGENDPLEIRKSPKNPQDFVKAADLEVSDDGFAVRKFNLDANGTFYVYDIDVNDAHAISINITTKDGEDSTTSSSISLIKDKPTILGSSYGTYTFTLADGSSSNSNDEKFEIINWTFMADEDKVNMLGETELIEEVINLSITDGGGTPVTSSETISIRGKEDLLAIVSEPPTSIRLEDYSKLAPEVIYTVVVDDPDRKDMVGNIDFTLSSASQGFTGTASPTITGGFDIAFKALVAGEDFPSANSSGYYQLTVTAQNGQLSQSIFLGVAERLSADAGGSVLDSKAGDDVMIGNGGADSFVLTLADNSRGRDIVQNFTDGSDKIRVDVDDPATITAANYLSELDISIAQGTGADASHILISYGDAREIVMVLEDITASDITYADFEFV